MPKATLVHIWSAGVTLAVGQCCPAQTPADVPPAHELLDTNFDTPKHDSLRENLVSVSRTTNDPRAATLHRLLDFRTQAGLEDITIKDALADIASRAGVEIDGMWTKEHQPLGLSASARVTLPPRDRSFLELIEEVIVQADEAGTANQTQYGSTWQLTASGVVQAGPRERLNAYKRVETYYHADLTRVVLDFNDVLGAREEDVTVFAQIVSARAADGYYDEVFQAKLLLEQIKSAVEPEQWTELTVGGASNILRQKSVYVVRAPDYLHRQIDGYDFTRVPAPTQYHPVRTPEPPAAPPVQPPSTTPGAT